MRKFDITNWRHVTVSLGSIVFILGLLVTGGPKAVATFDEYHNAKARTITLQLIEADRKRLEEVTLLASNLAQELQLDRVRSDMRALRAELYKLQEAQRAGNNDRYIVERIDEIQAELRVLEARRICLENGTCQ